MIPDNFWVVIMQDAIINAHLTKKITLQEAGRLRKSLDIPIDKLRMFVDTQRRLGRMG